MVISRQSRALARGDLSRLQPGRTALQLQGAAGHAADHRRRHAGRRRTRSACREPAFRRFARAGRHPGDGDARPRRPNSLDAVRAKIRGQTLSAAEIGAIIDDIAHYRYSDMEIAAFLIGSAEFHHQRRTARAHRRHGAGRHATEMDGPGRRRQALHRRHPRQPHVDDRGADRGGARPADSEDVLARHHLAGRHRRHDGGACARQCRRRGDEGDRRRPATAVWSGAVMSICRRPTTS